jgi:thiol:disulfide interchange protein
MKKPLTATQRKNRYRSLQYTTFASEFISILTPYIILGSVNFNEWFPNSEAGFRAGLGGALALALMGIAVFLVTKKNEENNKLTNGWRTLMVGWFCVAFVFLLLGNIIDQIAEIMLWGGLGIIGAFGLHLTSQHFKKKADLYKSALDKVEKDEIVKQVKEEKKVEPTE